MPPGTALKTVQKSCFFNIFGEKLSAHNFSQPEKNHFSIPTDPFTALELLNL